MKIESETGDFIEIWDENLDVFDVEGDNAIISLRNFKPHDLKSLISKLQKFVEKTEGS